MNIQLLEKKHILKLVNESKSFSEILKKLNIHITKITSGEIRKSILKYEINTDHFLRNKQYSSEYLKIIQDKYNSGLTWETVMKELNISSREIGKLIQKKILITRSKKEIADLLIEYYKKHPEKHPLHGFNPLKLTYPEKLTYKYLEKINIKFEPQFPIDRYWVDYLIPETKLVIEIDGEFWHMDKEYDRKRDNIIKTYGYSIIRIPAANVIENMEQIFGIYNVSLNLEDIKNEIIIIQRKHKFNIEKEELEKLIKTHNTREIGKMFSVSSALVSFTCKKLNIIIPKRQGNWHQEAHKLFKDGLSIKEISKILKMERANICNMLRIKYKEKIPVKRFNITKEELIELLKTKSMWSISKLYGVIWHTVRNKCIKFGISYQNLTDV